MTAAPCADEDSGARGHNHGEPPGEVGGDGFGEEKDDNKVHKVKGGGKVEDKL